MAKSKTTEAPAAAAKGKGKKAKEAEAPAEEENTVDEDTIRGMNKADLTTWIEEHDLDTKPEDHKKLADLKDAVIAELSDGDEDGDDDDDGDGDDDETLDVSEMDLDGLLAVIKDKGLSIKPKDAKAMKLKKLRKAVTEALAGDEDESEAEVPAKGKKAAKEEKTPKGSAKSSGKGSGKAK